MEQQTHQKISTRYVGDVVELKQGYARVQLQTREDMVCDKYGLIHGGFAFGLADYAAMAAVNHPNVVLGKAEVTFLAPAKLGEVLLAEAYVTTVEGKKSFVEVTVTTDKKIFEGTFICFSLDKHVLSE
jgi:uncharacterized protein (TIGR00369 family)